MVFYITLLILVAVFLSYTKSIKLKIASLAVFSIISFFFINSYISIDGGTPQKSDCENIFLQESGFYSIKEDKTIVLCGDNKTDGFLLDELKEDEFLKLKPSGISSANISTWDIEYKINSTVVRENSTAINVNSDNTLSSADTLCFYYSKDKSIEISFDFDDSKDLYVIRDCKNDKAINSDSIEFVKIKDGIRFNYLVKRFKNSSIANNTILNDIKNNLLLFRKEKGDADSDICFSYDFSNSNVFVTKKNNSGSTFINARSFSKLGNSKLDVNSILSVGYGFDIKFWSLAKQFEKVDVGGGNIISVAPIKNLYPKRVYLDKENKRDYLIVSTDEFVDYDNSFQLKSLGKTPIFSKITFNESFDNISLNTGEALHNFSLDEDFYIDNGEYGYLLKFNKYKVQLFGINLYFLLLFILVFALGIYCYIVLLPDYNPNYSRVKSYWLSLILIVTILAFIKLIVSYRLVVFSPDVANYKEINLISKTVGISFAALFLLPLVAFLPFVKNLSNSKFVRNITDLASKKIGNRLDIFKTFDGKLKLVAGILIVLALIGLSADSIGTVFGLIRLNILSLLFLFGLFYIFVQIVKSRNDDIVSGNLHIKWIYWAYISIVTVVVLINVLLGGDKGFLIVYTPVFYLLPILWDLLNNSVFTKKKYDKWYLKPNVVSLILFFVFITAICALPTVFGDDYRLQASNPEYFYEHDASDDVEFDETQFKNNTYQMWQFMNYAAHGEYTGVGYANMSYSKVGVTIPVSMTDGLFSMYILSEFGMLGAVALFILYLALIIYLILLAICLDKKSLHLSWIIIGVGIYFFHSSIYMALANIGVLPFTGQNIPFFSLSSVTDMLHFIILIAFVAIIAVGNKSGYRSVSDYISDGKKKSVVGLIIIAVFYLLSLLFLCFSIYRNIDKSKGDFSINKEQISSLKSDLNNDFVFIKNDSIKLDVSAKPLSIFLDYQVKLFNSRSLADKKDINSGFLFMTSNSKGKCIGINEQYYKIHSPFNSSTIWRGNVYAGDGSERKYQLYCLNTVVNMSMQADKTSMKSLIYPFDLQKSMGSTGFLKLLDSKGKGLVFFEMCEQGLKVFCFRDNTVFINGKSLRKGNNESAFLNPNDIMVFELKKKKYYFSLRVSNGDNLSRLAWVNGKNRRIYRYAEQLPYAYNISESATVAKLDNSKDLRLTLDMKLQSLIQSVIKDFAVKNKKFNFKGEELHLSKQISFTVMDSYTGEVKALGSWPNINPNSEDLQKYLSKLSPYEQERLMMNPNIRKHAIGSTFKPLTYAAMSLSFNSKINKDIANFKVFDSSNSLSEPLQRKYDNLRKKGSFRHFKHPHLYLAGINMDMFDKTNEFWDCSSTAQDVWIDKNLFFIHSLNFYQLNMFAMGLIQEDELATFNKFSLSTDSNNKSRTKFSFGANPQFLDVHTSDSFSDENNGELNNRLLSNAVVFKNLNKLFGINLDVDNDYNNYASLSTSWKNNLSSFIPSFRNSDKSYLKYIIPNPTTFNLDILPSRNDLEVMARGGGEFNRWSNIKLCEAFAKISVGKDLSACIEPKEYVSKDLAFPLSTPWRYENLIKPLNGVVTSGTARNILSSYNRANRLVIAKTGTINERNASEESEMLVFTIGNVADGKYVKGKTYTCYLYLEDSKGTSEKTFYRVALGKALAGIVDSYIDSSVKYTNEKAEDEVVDNTVFNTFKYDHSSRENIKKAIDASNPITRNYAVRCAGEYSGNFNINQVCAIFDDAVNRWRYVNDIEGNEYFASASETISQARFNGDCDDFAILIAASVRAVGGKTRVALAVNNKDNTGHAFTELNVEDMGSEELVKRNIVEYYRTNGISLNPNDIHINNGWLNLDWWSNPKHVGCRYFNYDQVDYIN